MPDPVLSLPILAQGHTVSYGTGVVRTEMPGGDYMRKDFEGAAHTVSVSWFCTPAQQTTISTFRADVFEAGLPFTISLIVDDDDAADYTARCVPGSFRFAEKVGDWAVYSATLEVDARASTLADDAVIILLYGEYGDQMDDVLALLETLVNVDLPAAIPA